jgi:RNA polymerase sigma-70 factor (ECF subfamily)
MGMPERLPPPPAGAPRPDAHKQFRAAANDCQPALYRRALGLTRNPSDARDLVQDTLERGFRSLHRFEGGTNMRVWLLRILVNLFIDECRRNARAPRLEALDEQLASSRAADQDDHCAEAAWSSISNEQFQATLLALDPLFRNVYELRMRSKLKYDEIARQLDIPVGTVATRLARARTKLRQLLAPTVAPIEEPR